MNKYISPKLIIAAAMLFAVILVFWRLIYLWSFPDSDWVLEKEEKIVLEPKPIFQKFSASEDNLSRVEFLFSSSGIKPGGIIAMKLLDENCSNLIREKRMKAINLDSENSYPFRFTRLPDSAGKIYCLSLSYQPFVENGKMAKIFLKINPPSESLSLIDAKGEEIKNKSLSMRPGYQAKSLRENVNRLNQRISQYKPWFLKHYFLYFIAFGFIILSVLLVVMLTVL